MEGNCDGGGVAGLVSALVGELGSQLCARRRQVKTPDVNSSQSQSNYVSALLQRVRHASALKRNILLQLLLFKGIMLFIELQESTYLSLKGYYLNVIFVKWIMTNFRLVIKHHMSQPINFDAESSIRCFRDDQMWF